MSNFAYPDDFDDSDYDEVEDIEDEEDNDFEDDETCANCDELKDGYSDEDGMGGHGWTCRLCGAFNCEWGC